MITTAPRMAGIRTRRRRVEPESGLAWRPTDPTAFLARPAVGETCRRLHGAGLEFGCPQASPQISREVDAPRVAVTCVLGQRLGEHRAQPGQFGPLGSDRGRVGAQVLADDDRRVGVLERRHPGEQVIGRRGQRVLVGVTVYVVALELFGCGVGHRADRHVGSGQPAGLTHPPGDAEVGEHDPVVTGVGEAQQDVGRFDVAVQQALAVRVVQRLGDRGDDAHHLVGRHPVRVAVGEQVRGIRAVDELHGDPELVVELPAVVDRHDVRVRQGGHHVGFEVEPLPVFVVAADRRAEDLQGVIARQPGMLNQVNLAHASGPEGPQDGVTSNNLAVR